MRDTQFSDQGTERPIGQGGSKLPKVSKLSFDLETTGKDLWSRGPDFVRVAGIRRDTGEVEVTTDINSLAQLCQNSAMVVGHNILGFDLLALARYNGLDIFGSRPVVPSETP